MSNGTPLSLGAYRQISGALVKNIPLELTDQDAQYWSRNGEKLKTLLLQALSRKAKIIQSEEGHDFTPWRSIVVLRGDTPVIERLAGADRFVGANARILQSQFDFELPENGAEYELFILSIADLGFEEDVDREVANRVSVGRGLELFPAGLAPFLAIEYQNQQAGEWLVAGMDSLHDPSGKAYVFTVECSEDGDKGLYAHSGVHAELYTPNDKIVFVRRKR